MWKHQQIDIRLGFAFAVMTIVGCGSPTTEDKPLVAPVAPVSSSARPVDPKRDTEQSDAIRFRLCLTEPLTGRVVATRTLERHGLTTLESRIEWAIRIEPIGERLRISSRHPMIGALRADLPEDALHQLLIGRMFLLSGVLDKDGTFSAAEGTTESVEALHTALSTASDSLLPRDDVVHFLSNALSESTIETTSKSLWKTMIQSFIGKSMQLGETYETEAPTDMPLGGSVVFLSKLRVVSQKPTVPGRSGQDCVRVESHSQPKGSLVEAIQKSAPGASIERFDMTVDMLQVVDPSTLVPHSLTRVTTTMAEMRFSDGLTAPMHEVSTENWQYLWDVRESRETD